MTLAVGSAALLAVTAVSGQPVAVALVVAAASCAFGVERHQAATRLAAELHDLREVGLAGRRRLVELESLLDAGRTLSADLELPEILQRTLDSALELLGASEGQLLLLEDDGLRVTTVRGDAATGALVPLGHGLAGRAAESREPQLADHAHGPAGLAVPLVDEDLLIGALVVDGESGRDFDEVDLRALALFAEHATGTLTTARRSDAHRDEAIALAHRAYHDDLTQLPNRLQFVDRLGGVLADDRLLPIAVVHIDLDDFGQVNESQGRHAGDEQLREVALRLRRGAGPGTLVARLSGDEFGVLIDSVTSRADAVRAAEEILRDLAADGFGKVPYLASAGVVVAQPGAARPDEVLRDAELAMYMAKGQGRSSALLFEPGMHASFVDRLQLEADLALAVEQAELELHYEPVFSLATGTVTGFEALVRWLHPERGLLPPSMFLPVAERTGLIVGIDRWVLLQACCQARAWQQAFPTDERITVGVNLAARQLQDDQIVEIVRVALDVAHLAPEDLLLDIHESSLVTGDARAVERLHALRALGVRLAIDDLGTGYSSLAQLRHLPVQVIKVARTYVEGLGRTDEDDAVVAGVIRLAKKLGLGTVAEGVERPAQRVLLADMGCDQAQGWYLARPLVLGEMEDVVRERADTLSMRVFRDALEPVVTESAS